MLSAVRKRRYTPPLSSALLGACQPGCCVIKCVFVFDQIKYSRTYILRGFAIEPRAVSFHHVEFDSYKQCRFQIGSIYTFSSFKEVFCLRCFESIRTIFEVWGRLIQGVPSLISRFQLNSLKTCFSCVFCGSFRLGRTFTR